MLRTTAVASLLAMACVQGVTAQQADPATHLYEAYYKVPWASLGEWNRQFNEYSVPILTALRDEGVIEGWGHWQHDTGGDNNVRFAVRARSWAAFSQFWSEYLSRLNAVVPAAEMDALGRMITAHTDEIWNIASVNVPDDLDISRMYTSTFEHAFADTEEFNRIWDEVVGPAIADAMAQGLLGGWVRLEHNTGPHSAKILYMFEDWDDIDDFFATFQSRLDERDPATMQRLFEMVTGHDDHIWAPAPQPGN